MIQELLRATKVKEVMASPAITVHESDEFHLVWEKFETYDIRHLPVIDESGGVCGLITQRQMYKVHSPRRLEDGSWYYDQETLDGFILKNVMLAEPLLLGPDSTLQEAMDSMLRFKTGCIPIVDKYRSPLGILTRDDVIRFFLKHA